MTRNDTTDELDVTVPETIDVSGYTSAYGQAKATYNALCEWAEFFNYDPEGVVLRSPEETEQFTGSSAWSVTWEAGFYEWGFNLSAGWSMTRGESLVDNGGEPQITGLNETESVIAEPHYSFDIHFHDH